MTFTAESSSSCSLSQVLVLVGSSVWLRIVTVLGAIFQGLSKTIEWLIFWRCATGLFAGSPIVTQAYVHPKEDGGIML